MLLGLFVGMEVLDVVGAAIGSILCPGEGTELGFEMG